MERQFDPWQREAIEISGGRHLVLAPPGCGKTDILTERVVHAHEAGIAYGDMLCLTFTNRAAKGMAQRIADRTGNPVPDELFVGNIHRYCSQMLFNEGIVNHNSAIIDESDVENIIQEELCKRLHIESRTTELMRFQHGLQQMVLGMRGDLVLHNELFRAGSLAKLCDVLGRPFDEDNIADIYSNIDNLTQRYSVLEELPAAHMMRLAKAYERYKEDNDLLDYDDLLILAYKHLNVDKLDVDKLDVDKLDVDKLDVDKLNVDKTTNNVSTYQPINVSTYQPINVSTSHPINVSTSHPINVSTKKYNWIEIDEVQDLNALQFALVDLFAAPDATIVYLGDEQQAIFSFIGAKQETLEALKRRCKGNIHYLHTNYRSPKYLLDLQNDFARKNLGSTQTVGTGEHRGERTEESGSMQGHYCPQEHLSCAPQHSPALHAPPKKEELCLLDVGDAQLESYYAARFAKRYGEMDPEGKVAILVSTNREADDIGEVMTGMGISHFKISGTDLFSLPAMRLLTAHLSVLTDEMVFIAWARLLWGLKVMPSYTAARNFMRDMRRVALLPTDFLLYPDSSYLQEFVHVYDNEEIVIFDTETTGLDVYHDDIIQIAAVKVRQGKVAGQPFNIILETDKELPETVGGHPNPMLEVYRKSKRHPRTQGLQLFLDYCKGKVLVGHNVEYDYQILKHNLQRENEKSQFSIPDFQLEQLCPRYFDTLKYIRLVRPRLRQYKLGHLLEVLHLEGQNSHQADDDIMATLSLLNFCHSAARQTIADQRLFISDQRKMVGKFHERYAEMYLHGVRGVKGGLENGEECKTKGQEGIAAELQYAYGQLLSAGLIEPIDKWQHLLHYLESDLIRSDLYPTLRQQLERYVTDLNTSKEADLCGSSLEEQYIISTVHKAKGLEFDTVIVYRAIDGSYPGSHSWTEKQIQEDARRLFVALSRSKRRLCVLYDDYYGRSTHALSPFLEKVKEHFTLFRRFPDGKIREV